MANAKTKTTSKSKAKVQLQPITATPEEVVKKAKAKGKDLDLDGAKRIIDAKNKAVKAEQKLHDTYGLGSGFKNKQGQLQEVDIIPGSRTHGSLITQLNEKGEKVKLDNKVVVKIRCAHDGCKEERYVATSDLQNVSMCHEHQKEHKAKSRKKSKRKSAAANLEAASILDDLLG